MVAGRRPAASVNSGGIPGDPVSFLSGSGGLVRAAGGYRSKYVVRAARSVVDGEFDLDAVSRMSYRKAKEELLRLFGVGEKVADCICLFGLHHLQAFPMDTHIKQAMAAHYKRGFPNRRYRGFQGVMQQYIFYYELCGKKEYI